MADVSREVRIAFEGDDRVSHIMKSLSGKLDAFGASVGRMTQPLADMADKVLKIEAALVALAAGGMALAFKASTDFETATVSLSKILSEAQQKYIPGITDEILNLSNVFGQSAVEFMNGAVDYKKAGFSVEEVSELIKGSATLVIAGSEALLGMDNATEILIATMKGFKSPAEDQKRIIDILNKVSNEYATSVTQLGIGMSKLSPIAKQMGFSYEETAAILVPVIEIFRSGDEAAVAFRTGLLKLVDDAKPVQDALEALGISQRDANGHLRSGKDILYDVAEAFKTAEEDEKLFLAAQLVGIRQAAKMVEVFNGLTYSQKILATAMGATGSAVDEVAKRFETAQISIDRMIQSVINLGIRLGDEFRAAAKEGVDGLSGLFIAMQNIVKAGGLDPLFDEFQKFMDNLGPQLRQIAEVMPEAFAGLDWSGLIGSLKSLGGEVEDLFGALFGDIDLTTAEGLRDFIQKLIDGFTALTNVAGSILDALEPFVGFLGDMVDKFSKSEEETQKFVGQVLGLGKAINVLSGFIPILTGFMEGFASILQLILISRIPGVLTGLGLLGAGATKAIGILGKLGIAGASFGVGWLIGDWLVKNVPIVDKFATGVADLALSFKGLDERSILFIENRAAETKNLGEEAVEAVRLGEKLGLIPSSKETEYLVKGTPEYEAAFNEILEQIQSLPDEKTTELVPKIDEAKWKSKADFILNEIPGATRADGTQEVITEIVFKPSLGGIDDTKKALEEIPSEKIIIARMENETEITIAEIKAMAATVQTSLEWKAKIEIAEVEELFETLRTQSESIRDMFLDTGAVITSIIGGFDALGPLGRADLMEILEKEMQNRTALVEQQRLLTEAEVKYLEEKTKRLTSGEAGLITIQMDGVYPELELVLHKIIERTQVRATQEGLDFLLGV